MIIVYSERRSLRKVRVSFINEIHGWGGSGRASNIGNYKKNIYLGNFITIIIDVFHSSQYYLTINNL